MASMMQAVMRLSTAGLDYLFVQADKIAGDGTREVLEGIGQDIKDNWSPESPSDPYTPPAVVSGYLDNSVKMERRDAAGRFASFGKAVTWLLRIEADYGIALEFGQPERGLIERPFFMPAVYRAEDKLGVVLTTEFQVAAIRANALTKADYLRKRGLG